MVALTGPNSTICGQISAIKRPSEVPPEVDNCGSIFTTLLIELFIASTRSPLGVRKGLPDSDQSKLYFNPCLSSISCTLFCSDLTVLAVEKRKLNTISTSPGITFVAPVPPEILEICQVVGGKYSLPQSHSVCASSATHGAAR